MPRIGLCGCHTTPRSGVAPLPLPSTPLNSKRGFSMTSTSATAVIESSRRFILLQILAHLHMPLHRRLTISLTSVSLTVVAPLKPMAIPFALLTPAQKQPCGAIASSVEDYRMVQKTASPVPWSMANRYCSHNLLPQTPCAPITMVGNTASGGMEKNGNCTFNQCAREHACSLCSNKAHNAQSCPTIL